MIGEHIISEHPNLLVKAKKVHNEVKCMETESREEENQSKQDSDLTEDKKEESNENAVTNRHRRSLPSFAFKNLSPVSEACVPCNAPGCHKYIHHSNMARHWRCWHPDLNKADYQQQQRTKTSPVAISTPKAQINNKFKDATATTTPDTNFSQAQDFKKVNFGVSLSKKAELSSDIRLASIKQDPEQHSPLPDVQQQNEKVLSPAVYNLAISSDGKYACKFEGCDYMSKYNSNMWRHQRKYNHFADGNRTL